MKCRYCGNDKVRTLGVSGAYDRTWTYCKDHYMRAKTERDAFLIKKGLPIFDRTPTEEEYKREHVSSDV